jgi:uncharacterized protein YndB with AHSA1/START domain
MKTSSHMFMEKITVSTFIYRPLEDVWDAWSNPTRITKWAFASDDWEAPSAKNDLRKGGKFTTRMQAKDGSVGFDFSGTYTEVIKGKLIDYVIGDGRRVVTTFVKVPKGTRVSQIFEPESKNPPEMQRQGWQNILENFKKYVEKGPS